MQARGLAGGAERRATSGFLRVRGAAAVGTRTVARGRRAYKPSADGVPRPRPRALVSDLRSRQHPPPPPPKKKKRGKKNMLWARIALCAAPLWLAGLARGSLDWRQPGQPAAAVVPGRARYVAALPPSPSPPDKTPSGCPAGLSELTASPPPFLPPKPHASWTTTSAWTPSSSAGSSRTARRRCGGSWATSTPAPAPRGRSSASTSSGRPGPSSLGRLAPTVRSPVDGQTQPRLRLARRRVLQARPEAQESGQEGVAEAGPRPQQSLRLSERRLQAAVRQDRRPPGPMRHVCPPTSLEASQCTYGPRADGCPVGLPAEWRDKVASLRPNGPAGSCKLFA